jgi:hypothetical protein
MKSRANIQTAAGKIPAAAALFSKFSPAHTSASAESSSAAGISTARLRKTDQETYTRNRQHYEGT